ncbi:TPA: hypothetical protein G8L11_003190 [Salmonella enterica]|nr:hypothetical protein [Salmonella enterica]
MCGEVRSLFCIFASHHAGWRLCLIRPTMLRRPDKRSAIRQCRQSTFFGLYLHRR